MHLWMKQHLLGMIAIFLKVLTYEIFYSFPSCKQNMEWLILNNNGTSNVGMAGISISSPYVTQRRDYLLIPFQKAIFINFCGNWTWRPDRIPKRREKGEEEEKWKFFSRVNFFEMGRFFPTATGWHSFSYHFEVGRLVVC